jgi:hypothetical protein
VNLFYVGGQDWAPAGDRGPPLLEQALDEFERIYAQAGLALGEVRQYHVVGGLRERLSFIELRYGVLEMLPDLLALSAGSRYPAINLFFVRQLSDTVAISGGTPGPLGMNGTGASGIALSADMFDDAGKLGRVIAHEVGHYLGLFHTSEMEGAVLDPLPDTAECRIDRDQDGDGILTVQECTGYGADNLMFWAAGGGTRISGQQASVLRAALILQ